MQIFEFVPWLFHEARRSRQLSSNRALMPYLRCSSASVHKWSQGFTVPPPEFVARLAACADYPPEIAILAADMARTDDGKTRAIIRRAIERLGGFDRFPIDAREAA